jgi:hypothetical protein
MIPSLIELVSSLVAGPVTQHRGRGLLALLALLPQGCAGGRSALCPFSGRSAHLILAFFLSFDLILCELLCPLNSALGHIPFIHSFDYAYIRLFTHSCASDFCEHKPPPEKLTILTS